MALRRHWCKKGGNVHEKSTEASSSKESTPTLAANTDSNTSVLLQAAVALVSGTNCDTEVPVRILFDSRNQRSYVSEHTYSEIWETFY